jgi:hypothetical protein
MPLAALSIQLEEVHELSKFLGLIARGVTSSCGLFDQDRVLLDDLISICRTAFLTCSISLACSQAAVVISAAMSLTFLTTVTISWKFYPECSTGCSPSSASETLSVINRSIFLAVSALR